MSQRENLLEGAKQCLREKGFAATTARDIAAASGANLASIGYHFGSKDALMSMAAIEAVTDWGDAVTEVAMETQNLHTADQRLSAFLSSLLSRIPDARPLLAGLIESYSRAQFDEDIRAALAASAKDGHRLLAAVVLNVPYDAISEEQASTTGTSYYALVAGLVLQSLVTPQQVPAPDAILDALALVRSR